MIAVPERISFREWVRGHRILLVLLAVVVLVCGTVALEIRQHRARELPMVAEIGKIEGLPALDAGDFDTAHRKLSAARKAVEALGGAYEGSEAIVQGAKEAAIFVDLAAQSLEEIVNEAARFDGEDWQRRFNNLYKGRAIVFDDNVADYRILSRSGLNSNRVGRIDTTGFKLLESSRSQGGESTHVYGARLASITLNGSQWAVRLEPDSGVVMTHWKALEAFGWPTEANKAATEDLP